MIIKKMMITHKKKKFPILLQMIKVRIIEPLFCSYFVVLLSLIQRAIYTSSSYKQLKHIYWSLFFSSRFVFLGLKAELLNAEQVSVLKKKIRLQGLFVLMIHICTVRIPWCVWSHFIDAEIALLKKNNELLIKEQQGNHSSTYLQCTCWAIYYLIITINIEKKSTADKDTHHHDDVGNQFKNLDQLVSINTGNIVFISPIMSVAFILICKFLNFLFRSI